MKESKASPPLWAIRFLTWFCPPQLHEAIEGDLCEQFESDASALGASRARRNFVFNTLRFFRPSILMRNNFSLNLIGTIMISNYAKVAIRNITRRKLYSFINASGLSIGISFCILIYLFIQDEKSFDQFHADKEQIFRIDETSYTPWWGGDPSNAYRQSAYLPLPALQAMKDELPEVAFGTHYRSHWSGALRYEEKVFTENFALVGPDFFKMFSFPILRGNAETLFRDKNEIVLTPAIAKKYFGDDDPIGKTVSLFIGEEKLLTVTGIIDAPPANSSLSFAMLVPIENDPSFERNRNRWGNFGFPTFIQLHQNADVRALGPKLDQLLDKYMGEKLDEWRKEYNVPVGTKMLTLQYTNLSDIHLKTAVSWHKVSDPQYSIILGGIGLLILIIACINYVSLSLTTSTSRRIEVGIRKVSGAYRGQLVSQFGVESVVLALLSMIIAITLVVLFLPFFNSFAERSISLTFENVIGIASFGFGLSVMIGLLAGSYPSLILSGFKPATVLKGRFTSRLQAGFTKPLVVIQFALSAFLIISSVIMFKQMRFITTKELGYNKEQLLSIPTQAGWSEASDNVVKQFRQALSVEPSVVAVAGTTSSFNKGYSKNGYKIKDEQKSSYVYAADPFYISTLELKLISGRNFDPAIAADSSAVIVNEALVKDMGWSDPLNEHLNWTEDSASLGYKVIGVLKDYHFLSLEETIDPMFLTMDKQKAGYLTTMLVRIKPDDIPGTVARMQQVWRGLYPDKPFDYTFVEDDVSQQYEAYQRWMGIMNLSTGFAIFIACLGLFGLSGINAVNRTKEVGIRKVMGADLSQIFLLLNKQYVWLAMIAFALAAPASWYVMVQWLADFKYRIVIGWELFAVSMFAGLFVAMATVSFHGIKAALINPAETLKYE
ncbi:MAG TPA: ABC transporter permease [Chryseosolibacter sp.]|nr:ABC transporter permease [Chryseosolibacter sp.]